MEKMEIVSMVVEALTVDGVVDVATLSDVIKGLQQVKKDNKEVADKVAKEKKAKSREEAAVVAKAYYASLDVGAEFTATNSKGETITYKKIAGKTPIADAKRAAADLVGWKEGDSANARRNVFFYAIEVPEEYINSLDNDEAVVA